jgi:hypothetical protein
MSKILDERELCDLECIVTGVFAPLTSYMTKAQYQECLTDMSVDSQIFPIPIVLSVTEDVAIGTVLELKNVTGVIHAKLTVQECWVPDLTTECNAVFGCFDDNHPYIKYILSKPTSKSNILYILLYTSILCTNGGCSKREQRERDALAIKEADMKKLAQDIASSRGDKVVLDASVPRVI